MLRWTNTGSHEDGRTTDRASGENNLARRENLAIFEPHADGAFALYNYGVHFDASTDCKVRPSANRGRQIGYARIYAHPVDDIEGIGADAMGVRAIEIKYVRQAESFGSLDESTHRWSVLLRCTLADREGAGATVPSVFTCRGGL